MARRMNQLRTVTIKRGYPSAAAGSVLISMGETRVICTASIAESVPRWLEESDTPRGWVTAEYNMMPGATPDRSRRGPNSRATEIQRLIGRSLRAAVDLEKMPGVMIICDCDVLYADGGTRTASITGAYVALVDAISKAQRDGMIDGNPVVGPVAAVSVGIVSGKIVLDLDYKLDSTADVDMNIVMNHRGEFVEVQGTGEANVFSRNELDKMLDVGAKGIKKLIAAQRKALR